MTHLASVRSLSTFSQTPLLPRSVSACHQLSPFPVSRVCVKGKTASCLQCHSVGSVCLAMMQALELIVLLSCSCIHSSCDTGHGMSAKTKLAYPAAQDTKFFPFMHCKLGILASTIRQMIGITFSRECPLLAGTAAGIQPLCGGAVCAE